MSDEEQSGRPWFVDPHSLRAALRRELEARGVPVASDTLGRRNELYVVGANDLSKALFEFTPCVRDAIDTMYKGSWGPDMPSRVAVMPSTEREDPSLELMEQMRIIPLFYDVTGGEPHFRDLDALLAEHVRD